MSMTHKYKSVYRRVDQKIFKLSNLRYLVDKKAALTIYKQAILRYMDYIGFMLSCTQKCKKDLQTLQNNALRHTCIEKY